MPLRFHAPRFLKVLKLFEHRGFKKWLRKVRRVFNKTGKIIKKSSDIYFSSNNRKLGLFFQKKWHKMAITRKIKIGKIWKLVLLSNEPISNLPCKLKKKKKKNFASFFCSYGVSELARFARGRIQDSSLTGSLSTAFQNCLLHCFSA